MTLSGGFNASSAESYLSDSTISANGVTISGDVTFNEHIRIKADDTAVFGTFDWEFNNNQPRLRLRVNGTDYLFYPTESG